VEESAIPVEGQAEQPHSELKQNTAENTETQQSENASSCAEDCGDK
jgi:hypothetical protein